MRTRRGGDKGLQGGRHTQQRQGQRHEEKQETLKETDVQRERERERDPDTESKGWKETRGPSDTGM